jgi:pilus assembly protein Flp/PilA
MARIILRLIKNDSGMTAIEYGLIAALVSIVILAAVRNVYVALNGIFLVIAGALPG